MKIPKLQTAWTTIPSDVTSSNWSVRLALQQAALQRQRRFAQALARLRLEDQRREDARKNQAIVTSDNRTTALRNQDLQQAAVKTTLIRKEQEKANNLQRFGQVTDATIKLTRPSTYMGYALTDKPFGEGFGNETANIAGDLLAAPLASLTRRGFQYASDIIPRVAQFGVSNHTGNWTRFGNNMYRLKPGYAGMNSVQIERRAAITPEDLVNRKFFPVEEYGSEPIYTRETAPTRIKVKEGDITESHMNDGTPGSEVSDANKVANEWFNNANHGQSVSYETDYSLSTDSYPIALLKMNRWQLLGLGLFIESESAPLWMRLNRLGNKSFEELQKAINRVNKLTGLNYKIKQMLSPMIGANGQPTLHPITKQPLMAKGIYVQPVGFFKYKKGSKIHANI